MQFLGNFKGKPPILSKFWAQGTPWGQTSPGPPWPKSSIPHCVPKQIFLTFKGWHCLNCSLFGSNCTQEEDQWLSANRGRWTCAPWDRRQTPLWCWETETSTRSQAWTDFLKMYEGVCEQSNLRRVYMQLVWTLCVWPFVKVKTLAKVWGNLPQ